MKINRATHILARLEIGFRTDADRLQTLEAHLCDTLRSARAFGRLHGLDSGPEATWNTGWDSVETTLRRIRRLLDDIHSMLSTGDDRSRPKALASWELIQGEAAALAECLEGLRRQGSFLSPAMEHEWDMLTTDLEAHLDTLRACTLAQRVRIELLERHSKAEVDQLIIDLLATLPSEAATRTMSRDDYATAYRNAAAQLDQERHRFMGFLDVVKGLLMWVETPEERMHHNLSGIHTLA